MINKQLIALIVKTNDKGTLLIALQMQNKHFLHHHCINISAQNYFVLPCLLGSSSTDLLQRGGNPDDNRDLCLYFCGP